MKSQHPLLVAVALLWLSAAPLSAVAEDGYDLWLRYRPVEAEWLSNYRSAVSGVVVGNESPTLRAMNRDRKSVV